MLSKFHVQKKASYIKRTAAVLIEKFDGDIPKTVEEMCCVYLGPALLRTFGVSLLILFVSYSISKLYNIFPNELKCTSLQKIIRPSHSQALAIHGLILDLS